MVNNENLNLRFESSKNPGIYANFIVRPDQKISLTMKPLCERQRLQMGKTHLFNDGFELDTSLSFEQTNISNGDTIAWLTY